MRSAMVVSICGVLLASIAAAQEPAATSNAVVILENSAARVKGHPEQADSPSMMSGSPATPSARPGEVGGEPEDTRAGRATLRALPAAQQRRARAAGIPGNWWTPFASLALVLTLIVVGAKVLRGYLAASQRYVPSEVLHVLGSSTIEPKLTLHVVRWGPRLLLVASGPQGARSLAELSDPEEIANLSQICREHRPRAKRPTLRQVWNPTQGLGLRRRLTLSGERRP